MNPQNNCIKVFIADDHQIIIDGLSLLINNEEGFEVVGMANDGLTAYEQIIILNPDIAILDIKMPELSGLEILSKLQIIESKVKIIILSMHHDSSYMREAFNHGAYAYLFKNASKQELIHTILMVNKGMKVFGELKKEETNIKNPAFFSKREKEVLSLIVQGYTTKVISEKLALSQYTVDSHRKSINRKTDCSTILQLIKWLQANELE